jgi:2-C-methyl-D-erythritol 4-phosphate cytidylyltransferase/2-C-methyl-D-erythritol 2,4-cyclodiphosphate synthase
MSFAAILVAAGSGVRAGGETPKQWRTLAGRPVARWPAEALLAAGADEVIAVVRSGDDKVAQSAFAGLARVRIVSGGAERLDSVRAGLAAVPNAQTVLIHDAARPFLSTTHVAALLDALVDSDAALPALPVADTLKRDRAGRIETVSRDGLYRAQTPQAFRADALKRAHAMWPAGETPTDDAVMIERAGGRVRLVAGDPMLMKLTYPEDFLMAERLAGAARLTRTGFGLDAHRFGPGDGVWLCGIRIPHTGALIGHSDADAGLHALTDAILGAIGEGDIGDHFPPSDPKWKGASSDLFLRHAAGLVRSKGGRLVNVDVTLVCERPKIKPHRDAMRARMAEILELPLDRVSVKATTMEQMGFTGREEGLAAQAIATVETPA